MEFTHNKQSGIYTIQTETRSIDLTTTEVSFIVNHFMKESVRETIGALLHEMDGDTIDLSQYPYSFEEFVDEIFVDLEDEIDYGNFPTEDDIRDKIEYVADFYEHNKF